MTSDGYNLLRKKFAQHGQEHVFSFYERLSAEERKALIDNLQKIDIEKVTDIWRTVKTSKETRKIDSNLLRPPSVVYKYHEDEQLVTPQAQELSYIGLEAIKKGEVAALTLCGGQGTRLGSSLPKGCYDIGLQTVKSLFQIQAERLASLQRVAKTDKPIHWYLMTSNATHNDTVQFFAKHNFFGLHKSQVHFFQQGLMPCFSLEGKLMLETKTSLCLSPDGNGGIYAALKSQKILSEMKSFGIKYVHVFSVDNCLVKICDPVFVGLCRKQDAECGFKVVAKTEPSESVGIVCQHGSQTVVVEYSEIDKTIAERMDSDGSLMLKHANIANHLFTVNFLESIDEKQLPFHAARKKIPCISLPDGIQMSPSAPNGVKLELFIFDVLPFVKNLCILEVSRKNEFSPLKNAPGSSTDSPQTSKRDFMDLSAKFLRNAGAVISPSADGEIICEVSPAVSYFGENLEMAAGRNLACPILVRKKEDLEGGC